MVLNLCSPSYYFYINKEKHSLEFIRLSIHGAECSALSNISGSGLDNHSVYSPKSQEKFSIISL